MTIEPFQPADIASFLHLASGEGWVAEQWEFDFLLATFPLGCLCVRDKAGEAAAFVTAIIHGQSGWLGNLIVRGDLRGQGVGEALFLRGVQALRAAGAETLWLTASKMGKGLYEKHGFATIDTILRWSGAGRQMQAGRHPETEDTVTVASASSIDSQAWGDRRDALLAATVGRGRLLIEDAGFLVVQPCGDAMQFGPFATMDNGTAEKLLDTALGMIPYETRVCLDAPLSNRPAMRLFNRRRMRVTGTNELMYMGKRPSYRPGYLFGLATMGSCG